MREVMLEMICEWRFRQVMSWQKLSEYITFLTFQTRSEMQFIAQPYVPLLGDLISGAFGGIV